MRHVVLVPLAVFTLAAQQPASLPCFASVGREGQEAVRLTFAVNGVRPLWQVTRGEATPPPGTARLAEYGQVVVLKAGETLHLVDRHVVRTLTLQREGERLFLILGERVDQRSAGGTVVGHVSAERRRVEVL